MEDVTDGTLASLNALVEAETITQEQYFAAGDAYSATKGRQLYVLDRMLSEGRISNESYVAAAIEPITPNVQTPSTGCAVTAAPFFCQYVVNTVRNDPTYSETFGSTSEQRQAALTRGGLSVYTTLDWRMQEASQSAMNRYAPASVADMNFGSAAVSVDSTTGRILSIAQNNRFTEDAALAASDSSYTSLTYAGDRVHGGSDGFSTGSTFKLFTLIDWLEKGHSINEVVDGNVRVIPRLEDRCNGPWINLQNDVVQNFGGVAGYRGIPVQFAAQSLNSGFLAMAQQLDLCDIAEVAGRLGVTRATGDSVQMDGAASIIGTNNVAPVTMAAAYGAVANGGVLCTPRVIDRVIDADGNEIPLPDASCRQAISPDVAAAASAVLAGVMRPGGTGSTGNPNDGTPVIGKTGTHEAWQTWLVESSTHVATAVWAGNTIGEGDVFRAQYNGLRLSNVRTPIARDIQRAANQLYPAGPLAQPPVTLTQSVSGVA